MKLELPEGYRVEHVAPFLVVLHYPGGASSPHTTEAQAIAWARSNARRNA